MLEKKFIPNKKFIKQINSAIITKMSDKIIQSYRAYGTGKHGKVLLAWLAGKIYLIIKYIGDLASMRDVRRPAAKYRGEYQEVLATFSTS